MENITTGHWIFAGIFMLAFVGYLIWSYRKDLKLHKTRKSKKILQACKTTKQLPKNWFDTKMVPKQVKDIKKRLKNHIANQKFSKKK